MSESLTQVLRAHRQVAWTEDDGCSCCSGCVTYDDCECGIRCGDRDAHERHLAGVVAAWMAKTGQRSHRTAPVSDPGASDVAQEVQR